MRSVLSFVWKWIKAAASAVGKLVLRYPLAALATVVLVAVAVVLLVSGKTFQIGGLLGRLWGRKAPETKRGVPPKDRVDKDGKPVEPGKPDDKGWVQAPVSTSIEEPGIFSNPDQVVVTTPDKGRVTVDLPTGVKNTDVREVVVLRPEVKEVGNNDKPTADPDEVYMILTKGKNP